MVDQANIQEGVVNNATVRPDPEVPQKVQRRQFTAAYKQRILEAADRCSEPGQVGALLRREGLYSSHLTNWRREREHALNAPRRGRKRSEASASFERVAQLERENDRLRQHLKQAQTIIEVQKKVSELLGLAVEPSDKA